MLPHGRRLRIDPRDRPIRHVHDARHLDPGAGDAGGRRGARRAQGARRARRVPPGRPCPIRSRAAPRRRCAACDGPAPSRPPPNRLRAAAARPGAGGRRRRPPPSPRGSAAPRASRASSPVTGATGRGARGCVRGCSRAEDSGPLTGKLSQAPTIVDACSWPPTGTLIVSATDLVGYLACDHLATLELGRVEGRWDKPDPQGRPDDRPDPREGRPARGRIPRRAPRARPARRRDRQG